MNLKMMSIVIHNSAILRLQKWPHPDRICRKLELRLMMIRLKNQIYPPNKLEGLMGQLQLGRDQEISQMWRAIRTQTISIHIVLLFIARNRVVLVHSKLVQVLDTEITLVSQMKFLISHQHLIQKYSLSNRTTHLHNVSEAQGGKQPLFLEVEMQLDHN